MPKKRKQKLTHDELIKFMNAFHEDNEPGYKMQEDGICFGVAHMAIQAILVPNGLESFIERLKKISALNKALKSDNRVADDISKDHDLRAFFDGIALYFEPNRYSTPILGDRNQYLSQELGMERVHSIIRPVEQAELDLNQVGSMVSCCQKNDVLESLNILTKIFNDSGSTNKSNLALKLGNHNHAIALSYNRATKTWQIINANKLAICTKRFDANSPEDLIKLSEIIFQAFEVIPGTTDKILLETKIYSPEKNKLLSKALNDSEVWSKLNNLDKVDSKKTLIFLLKNSNWHNMLTPKLIKLFSKKMDLNNSYNKLLYWAVYYDNYKVVRQLLKSGVLIDNRALQYAVDQNNKKMIRILLKNDRDLKWLHDAIRKKMLI
jgi:hypothetical protein